MKRIRGVILTLCVILILALASPLHVLAAQGNNTVLIMRGREAAQGRELEVDVIVEENAGVCGMLLSLVYDTSALTLTGLEYGTALSSLSPIHTNTDTPDGYAVYPFKLTYLGEVNDTSTGRMMTLRFRVNEDAANGVYTIALQHERDRDVTYLSDGQIHTKNLLISDATVTISEHEIVGIDVTQNTDTQLEDTGRFRVLLPVLLVGGVVLVGGGILLVSLLIKRRKRKKWTKL